MSLPDPPHLPLFNQHPLYNVSNRREFTAHEQGFAFYEFSIGFVSHQFFREQFEAWLGSQGRHLANLDNSPETTRRLGDLAWQIWFRGRPAHNTVGLRHRIGKNYFGKLLPYEELLTEDFRPLFEDSTFWLAERLEHDRDRGHIWKVLSAPLHIASTLTALEQLITEDAPSRWRMVCRKQSTDSHKWYPDYPSRRTN